MAGPVALKGTPFRQGRGGGDDGVEGQPAMQGEFARGEFGRLGIVGLNLAAVAVVDETRGQENERGRSGMAAMSRTGPHVRQ